MVGYGSVSHPMVTFLQLCVEKRKNMIVSGGTGSGKTTFLNLLSNFIPNGERIITIEDAAELKLNHSHLVSLESRPSNVEGRGAISIRDLVKNALRMRPDRIVVGECRGGEALDMLQAMNTGHEGSMTTLHANTPRDALARLETLVLMAGMDLPIHAIREQIGSAVDIVVQQSRFSCGSRKGDQHHGDHRHGERPHPAAGTLPLRDQRPQRRRQGDRSVHRLRSDPVLLRRAPRAGGGRGPVAVRQSRMTTPLHIAGMNPSNHVIVTAVTVCVALAIALLTWSLFDIGTNGLARYRRLFTERTHVSMRELFLFVEPQNLFALNLGTMLLVCALSWMLSQSVFLAIGLMVGMAFVPRFLLRYLHRRRLDALELQLPDTLLMLAGGMKAGISLTQAIGQLVLESRPPVSQEFDLVLREQRLGVSMDVALDNLNARVPLQSITLTVSAMRIAVETGGQLAETLERASQTLRTKLAMEAKIRALTSQGKLQAVVVGALPMVLMYALYKLEPAAMNLMFTTTMGHATLAVIFLLECFGVMIIRKIVAIDV